MPDDLLRNITRRYGSVEASVVESIMAPALVRLISIGDSVARAQAIPGRRGPWVAPFTVEIPDGEQTFLTRGRTGKFVPRGYVERNDPWREIAKGRVLRTPEPGDKKTSGEIYLGTGGSETRIRRLITEELEIGDYLEIDRYGASAKITSALVEASFVDHARQRGFAVRRMPEDVAKHIAEYYNYDFEIEKEGETARVEVKSLWGTDTTKARLIRSTGPETPTSSCKFASQDIFAVSRFLRTGNLNDWAFCRSISKDVDSVWGLPVAVTRRGRIPIHDHVTQNPPIDDPPKNPPWFVDLDDVFERLS